MKSIGDGARGVVSPTMSPISQPIVQPILREDHLPPEFDRTVDRELWDQLVGFYEGRPKQSRMILRRAMTEDERRQIEARVAWLQRALMPFPQGAASTLLALVQTTIGGYPGMDRHDAKTAENIALGYLNAIVKHPYWAIMRVCGLLKRGEYPDWDPQKRPSEGKLSEMIARYTAHYKHTRDSLIQLLQAPTEDELKIDKTQHHGSVDKWLRDRGLAEEASRRKQAPAMTDEQKTKSDSLIYAEYNALGLKAPLSNGRPVSLSLLKSLGWEIKQTSKGPKLRNAYGGRPNDESNAA